MTHLRGLIALLRDRVPLAEQLDWDYCGSRPEFEKVIRKFQFRDFNELTQIGRIWEMAWAAAKEYRAPPPPENSFPPEFAYWAETTPAAHKRTSVLAIPETATPPRNSGGLHLGSRNTKGQGNKKRSDVRNKDHPMGFTGDRPKKSEEPRGPRNFRDTGSDFKVGGGQWRPSTSAEKVRKDSGTEKEVICFRCQKLGHFQIGCALPRKIAYNCCKTEGYVVTNCPNWSGNVLKISSRILEI